MVSRSGDLTAKIVKRLKIATRNEKGESEPSIEWRNRKDMHIDQYGVDWQHERSGGNRDRGKRGKRDEKGERTCVS
jgi:hypothetical protein